MNKSKEFDSIRDLANDWRDEVAGRGDITAKAFRRCARDLDELVDELENSDT